MQTILYICCWINYPGDCTYLWAFVHISGISCRWWFTTVLGYSTDTWIERDYMQPTYRNDSRDPPLENPAGPVPEREGHSPEMDLAIRCVAISGGLCRGISFLWLHTYIWFLNCWIFMGTWFCIYKYICKDHFDLSIDPNLMATGCGQRDLCRIEWPTRSYHRKLQRRESCCIFDCSQAGHNPGKVHFSQVMRVWMKLLHPHLTWTLFPFGLSSAI